METHPVYKNLFQRDTLFGLSIGDIMIMGVSVIMIFKFHPANSTISRLINLLLGVAVYSIIVFIRYRYPKGYFKRLTNFLFYPRIYLPKRNGTDGDIN